MLLPLSTRKLPGLWHRRKASLVGTLLVLLSLLFFLQNRWHGSSVETASIPIDTKPPRPTSPLLKNQTTFWRDLYLIILNNDPNCDKPPEVVVPQKLDIGYDSSHAHPRPDVMFMESADVTRMREAHTNFINDLRKTPPKMPYEPGTRGIVMTAGFNQLPVMVISIRMLRRTWSLLPVEVLLADPSDYDEEICDNVLPTLNAKCLVLSDIFQAAETGVSIDKYQYKIMAVLFSSFEEVLLLDSDAFPVYNPLTLFEQEPFKSTGMIVWPDFWYASESPYYFEIAKTGDIPLLSSRACVESGQLMYSKSKHSMSIMLAAYYNLYGPTYYYPLLSQGAPGQGDKETFAWAAAALNEEFYPVREHVMALGRFDSNGQYSGSAMAQHDPIADYVYMKTHGVPVHPGGDILDNPFDIRPSQVRPFFIHANFPKFDPSTIFNFASPTHDTDGSAVRCWMGEERATELFGFDVERAFWEEIMGTACEYEHKFGCWKGKQGICERTTQHFLEVFHEMPNQSRPTDSMS
ncbi:mannosyltransferase [Elasticomyces elasticus]|uniref:Mannosyltransferase n=1 Tax=Exophiala sideris TaxID=1016849 RepID=A0ABR0JIT4_9EURO|nr:mannosyltransferase [Elasticomyces elasticus]KAK5034378.1 mannosyltransferase [Exophiala sideris]KAK5042675.1 mannosyltransferase [Exophiala sideris]KAK5065757.1 mannosyltransferase [Exophiala sideris]KAK5185783.1 mannosyltransferase [Eurotiomycetes sp. CCFEE 6388]